MISGPHTSATVALGFEAGAGQQRRHDAHRPLQSGLGRVDGHARPRRRPARQRARSSPKTTWSGERAPTSTNSRPGPPAADAGRPERSTAPRSGASPIPPATTTTSALGRCRRRPSRCRTAPRTPTTSPTGAPHRAWVTAPTSRTVCSSGPPARRRAAHRDRHLADAEGGEHVELPGPQGAGRALRAARATAWSTSSVSTGARDTHPVGRRGQRVAAPRRARPCRRQVSAGRCRRGRGAGAGSPGAGRGSRPTTRFISS